MQPYSIVDLSIKKLFIILSITVFSNYCYGQNSTYSQFWNEVQFTKMINKKWSAELDLTNSYSSTESSSHMFKNNVQKSFRFWGHYNLSAKWKTSAFIAHYDNKDVPEIGQFKSPEWRFALQGIYYFHKNEYTLSTRSRLELRHIRNEDRDYENVFRFRQQIKYLQPLNDKSLHKGVIYGIASDEIFFKSGTKVTGESFFDRNRFNIGGGYLFTDDIQLEVTYANEYLPRKSGNQTINAASMTITFNDLFKNRRKSF
ncbi:DUF2490 domain-containing protein [Flavobacterium reichenbachii]|uniref:DUF2490 domain-containing protein n=1 Tax=Flavobacterium reichenbachii TaxID=362418 RepID=A0A085ZLG8_9FLAO|nr:DUF2490 domain-containing protein [Flavobacterium reichenbachii]KFF05282.1 hypothetical protein IW19_06935 [Flavobacterium reichenbachii]